MSKNIQPHAGIFPEVYPGDTQATMICAVINSNPDSKAALNSDDFFQFTFERPWGSTVAPVKSATAPAGIFVDSPSGTLKVASFKLTVAPGGSGIRLSVVGAGLIPFPPGEAVAFAVEFHTPPGLAVGKVTASGNHGAGRLDAIQPAFTMIAFTAGTQVVNLPPGTEVNVGPGSHVNVMGSQVDAGDGSSVDVKPGADVNLPPGGGPIPKTFPTGPNFLQVAALKWYEASGLQRVALPARPDALVFDGRFVWIAMSGFGSLARFDPNTGAVTTVPLSGGLPGAGLQAFNAMAYDGQSLWISGDQGGVVARLDGTIDATLHSPVSVAGTMLFDGSSIWGGMNTQITRTPVPNPLVPAWQNPQRSWPVNPVLASLAFDGTHVWVASSGGLNGNVMSIRATDGQVDVNKALAFAPTGLTYDGRHLWIADGNHNKVAKCGLDGNVVATCPTGANPCALLFDGAHVWVANRDGASVTKLRASDAVPLGTFAVDPEPTAMVFDGISVWVASSAQQSIRRL